MRRIAVLLSFLAGCNPQPKKCPSGASEVELRDGKGALVLSARRGPEGALDLCDAKGLLVGSARVDSSTVRLVDRSGVERFTLAAKSNTDASATRLGKPRLRVHREGAETHVLQPDGVRFGTASTAKMPEKVEVFDRGSMFMAAVTPRGGDQAITNAGGEMQWQVIRAASSPAAAMFALPNLDSDEKLALYLLVNSIWRVWR